MYMSVMCILSVRVCVYLSEVTFESYGAKKPTCKSHRELFSRTFGTNKGPEGQLVGQLLRQRLATGETGVKPAR